MYESQHDLFHEIPGEGIVDVLEFWFVAGVVIVALDTLRRKSASEQSVWWVAAISFGLTAVGFAIGGYATIMLGVGGSGFIEVIARSLASQVLLLLDFFSVTQILGAPAYTLFLTLRAIRSWRTYLRPA